ncbi:hypothetical protein ONZ45_g12104 [Pleurotus djamor]|nr:hypothetical protein ONZ45_g12104 [Pleurotus djamor]
MSAHDLTTSRLTNLQFSGYIHAASLSIFDYFITFPDEVQLVWGNSHRLPMLLFYLNRYLPFFDLPLTLYNQVAYGTSTAACKHIDDAVGILYMIGILVSELIMVIRLWNLWGLLAALIPIAVTYATSNDSVHFIPLSIVRLPGCYPYTGGELKVWDYVLMMSVESVVLILTVVQWMRSFELFARDGIAYFSCLIAVGIISICVTIYDGDDGIDRMIRYGVLVHDQPW